MSMSMHCVAVKPADEHYKRMAAVWHACTAAKIPIPKEVDQFFDGERPDETGITQQLGYISGDKGDDLHPSCSEHWGDSQAGFNVDITKLPEGTRYVRFYCSR